MLQSSTTCVSPSYLKGCVGLSRRAFSLVELIVVIGIIALLISLLLPALAGAQQQARSAVCASNMKQMGTILILYQNDNNGWVYPVGKNEEGETITLGTNQPPHERWPTVAWPELQVDPNDLPYDPTTYVETLYQPEVYDPKPFHPDVLLCPNDPDAWEAHSYVLNYHLILRQIKAGSSNFNGLSSPDVVMAGEKVTVERDYYMERSDFGRLVEKNRHGIDRGSNYLYFDISVRFDEPGEAWGGVDPWDPVTYDPEDPNAGGSDGTGTPGNPNG